MLHLPFLHFPLIRASLTQFTNCSFYEYTFYHLVICVLIYLHSSHLRSLLALARTQHRHDSSFMSLIPSCLQYKFPISSITMSSEVCLFCSRELGSSRRSFRKSSRKSQPIREEEEEEFIGKMAFSDEERQQGVPSRDRPEPEGE